MTGFSGPRNAFWKDDEEFWTGSDSASCDEVHECNNSYPALEVVGQDWSSEVVALFLEELGACAVCFELPHGLEPVVPGNERSVPGKISVTVFV